jgi:hypothetical protein
MAIVMWDPGRTKTLRIPSGGTDSDILDLGAGPNNAHQVTRDIIKGAAGGKDLLPDPNVVAVSLVKQGGTTYVVTTDYTVSGNVIDWAPAGSDPAVGSVYQVTYTFTDNVAKSYRRWDITILAPATLTAAVKPQIAKDSGGPFKVLQSGGADIGLTADKATALIPCVARFLKLVSAGAEAGDRDFILMGETIR